MQHMVWTQILDIRAEEHGRRSSFGSQISLHAIALFCIVKLRLRLGAAKDSEC